MSLFPRSLSGRLFVTASALVLVTVLLTGVAMDFVLRRFIQGQVDGRLDGQILAVADALRVAPDGSLRLERIVDGPPFERPLSGWYWEVLAPAPVLRSSSLGDKAFAMDRTDVGFRPKPVTVFGTGPRREALRVRVQNARVGSTAVTIATAAPLEALAGPRRQALTPLALMLVALALVMLGGALLQVRLGLRPLALLRRDLSLVRRGYSERVSDTQPTEIAPLVSELNTLLDQNAANLERARRHVANLAHALKTPLATLALALEQPGADLEGTSKPLVLLMDRRIRHHLSRARAAAIDGGRGRARVLLAPHIEDHLAAFGKLYADKNLAFSARIETNLSAACDKQDLDEIFGNLIDNACRWTRHTVEVRTRSAGRRIEISIEDDGPGLSDAKAADMLRRGRRLDEAMPGYGFGLPIASELIELYGGSITLGRSEIGGLCAEFTLPS